jgi:hypothetical protein
MPDFDTTTDFQLALAVRRRVASDDVTQIGNLWLGQVAAKIDASQVKAGFIGAANKITQRSNGTVGKNGDAFAVDRNRPDIAWFAAQIFFTSLSVAKRKGEIAAILPALISFSS